MYKDLKNNQNSNGGGLATNITGKFESNRHALAKLEGKRTAGEVASKLRKLGYNYYAKDVKLVCEEWHHAGLLPKNLGGGMAKTYFTRKQDAEILNDLEALKNKHIEVKKEVLSNETGFYYEWGSDYNGQYGKKRNFKICRWFNGEGVTPKNFTKCTKEQFENANLKDGQIFYGWSEPKL